MNANGSLVEQFPVPHQGIKSANANNPNAAIICVDLRAFAA
jgi:hypothetical protein